MFSVIVPTYNRPLTLQKLLESLELQTISKNEFEVIVVFATGDTSQSLLKSYKSSFTLIPLEIEDKEFSGTSASLKRNQGALIGRFPWLAFTDDDCITDANWLSHAKSEILKKNPAGIEGKTIVPQQDKKTFTAHGMSFLSLFGGYQTCNMFYDKEIFFKLGGFDKNLPFYLEDTDIAWCFLEAQHSLYPAENVIVTHPVPPPNTYRWIENAIRTRKIPYLAKKHPQMYKKTNFKALSKSTLFMGAVFLFVFLLSAISQSLTYALVGSGVYLALSSLYVFYILRRCHFKPSELLMMLLFFPLIPLISLFQLVRGNIEQRTFVF